MRDENNQISTGHGAIQIHGNHNTVNHHQHSHTHQHQHQHDHHHTHIEAPPFALQAPPAPPARTPRPKRPAYDITPAQKELLALMRPLPKPVRIEVLAWLRCEFGTSLVMELEPRELHQTRQHVLDVRRAAGV